MKIICIGQNYKKHIEEFGSAYPENPIFFLKPDSAILVNNKDFFLPDFSDNMQHEIELIIRINRLGKHIKKKFAHRYYNEVGLGIDMTARDLQQKCKEKGLPWEIAKAFDGSAVISTFIPLEDVGEINNLDYTLIKNDVLVQAGNTSDMIFDVDTIIEYVSQFFTLKIGDIIYTGTPSGVGKLSIGDNLKAFLGKKELINMKIK